MIRIICAAFGCCVLFLPVHAATIDLPQLGFQIEALDGAPGQTPIAPLLMCLEVSNGFAPNINVQIQPYSNSMSDYVTLSKAQFVKANLTLIEEKKTSENEWSCEYKGFLQGKNLHFFARAILGSGRIYLATATNSEDGWSSTSEILRHKIDTFKLD